MPLNPLEKRDSWIDFSSAIAYKPYWIGVLEDINLFLCFPSSLVNLLKGVTKQDGEEDKVMGDYWVLDQCVTHGIRSSTDAKPSSSRSYRHYTGEC